MNISQPTTTTRVFFLKHLAQGIIALTILITIFVVLQDLEFSQKINLALQPIYDNTALMYAVYTFSEICCGILPSELFIIWGLRTQSILDYIVVVTILASISYLAGIIGFYFGRLLGKTILFRYLRRRFLAKHQKNLMHYGGILIIIASLTPVPYCGVCILSGASGFPRKKFLLFASSRFLRFACYAIIIWSSYMI